MFRKYDSRACHLVQWAVLVYLPQLSTWGHSEGGRVHIERTQEGNCYSGHSPTSGQKRFPSLLIRSKKRQLLQLAVLGKLDPHMQKNEIRPLSFINYKEQLTQSRQRIYM